MKLEVKFSENNKSFSPKFSEVHNISDGGYERGYSEGYKVGFADGSDKGYKSGYTDGYVKGREEGYADGQQAGYARGYVEGYEKGFAEGKAQGKQEGYSEGHSVGYAEGKVEGYTEGKSEGYTEGKSDGVSEGYEQGKTDGITEGIGQGKQIANNELWANALDEKQNDIWQYRFAGASWNDETFRPTQDIKPSYYADHAFYMSGITDLVGCLEKNNVKFDTSKATARADSMFAWSTKLTRVPYLDFSNANTTSGITSLFQQCTSLHTVEGLNVGNREDLNFASAFQNCYELVNITIDGVIASSNFNVGKSTKLSKASITSIINALSLTKSGYPITLSKDAVNNAFSTEEWNTLIATKTNWTITLV